MAHAIPFQPQRHLQLMRRKSEVIICQIIGRKRIVLGPYGLRHLVVRWNVLGARKHQVLKEMGKTGMFRVFVPGTHLDHDVQGAHSGVRIRVHQDRQAVGQDLFGEACFHGFVGSSKLCPILSRLVSKYRRLWGLGGREMGMYETTSKP